MSSEEDPPLYMSEDGLRIAVEPGDPELRDEYESLIRDDYKHCHPSDSLEYLKRRARFSKEDQGLLRDWMAVAAQRARQNSSSHQADTTPAFGLDNSVKAVMLKPVFYDFEASGLDGYPIEVGWALVDDQIKIIADSSLILPDPKWDLAVKWDITAEQIHGISLKHLMENGTPPRQVGQELNNALAGLDLYSDSLFDQKWMGQLFEAAGVEPTFTLQDKPAPILIEELRAELGLTEDDVVDLYRLLDHKAPHLDRAKPDARHWAARWQALLRLASNR